MVTGPRPWKWVEQMFRFGATTFFNIEVHVRFPVCIRKGRWQPELWPLHANASLLHNTSNWQTRIIGAELGKVTQTAILQVAILRASYLMATATTERTTRTSSSCIKLYRIQTRRTGTLALAGLAQPLPIAATKHIRKTKKWSRGCLPNGHWRQCCSPRHKNRILWHASATCLIKWSWYIKWHQTRGTCPP